MSTLRVTSWRLPALALAALASVWLVAPQGVPLYDGVNLPDSPYRYVAPPPGWPETPPPGEAVVKVPVVDPPKDFLGAANTPEYPQAQAQLRVPPESLRPPKGAKEVVVTASPVAPDVSPAGFAIDGNVYRVALSAFTNGDTTLIPSGQFAAGIGLLSTFHNDKPGVDTDLGGKVFYRTGQGAPWEQLTTDRVPGAHVYIVDVTRAGDYAIGLPPRDTRSSEDKLLGVVTDGSVRDRLILGLVVIGIGVVLWLLWRGLSEDEDEDEADDQSPKQDASVP